MKSATVLPTADQAKARRYRARLRIAAEPRHCAAVGCPRMITETWTGDSFCSTTCRLAPRTAP